MKLLKFILSLSGFYKLYKTYGSASGITSILGNYRLLLIRRTDIRNVNCTVDEVIKDMDKWYADNDEYYKYLKRNCRK